MDFSRQILIFDSFQTIFDSGTYEELCQRQSITAESIYGDEFDADPTVSSDVDSPSDGQNSNPESDNNCAKDKRHQFLRQNSVLQYMRDQTSIDDDPVNILQKIVSIYITVSDFGLYLRSLVNKQQTRNKMLTYVSKLLP